MGWSIGYDQNWNRDIGYGVPAQCDHPDCTAGIDRGLSYVCGGAPYGGEHGCGLHFCWAHLRYADDKDQRCERCIAGADAFSPSQDVPEWLRWKLTDESWGTWRSENPDEVRAMAQRLEEAS